MLLNRSIAWCIILSFLTCGIYPLFWMVGMNNEFARQNDEIPNGVMMIFLCFITCGIYYFIWNYKMGFEIEKAGGNNDGILYLILALFGLGLISLALMQVQENHLCTLKLK